MRDAKGDERGVGRRQLVGLPVDFGQRFPFQDRDLLLAVVSVELESCPDLSTGPWTPVSGQTDIPGTGGLLTLSDANGGPSRFYRVSVRMP